MLKGPGIGKEVGYPRWLFSYFHHSGTVVGICVVNFYNAYRCTLSAPWKQRSFVDYMFRDMLNHGGRTARAEDDGDSGYMSDEDEDA